MSNAHNTLYLFYPNSLIGWIICLITRTPYAHTAISVNGVLWDSSESRGDFNRSTIDLSKRKHVAIRFKGDLTGWLEKMQGTKYDWLGVFGWLFRWNTPNKYFCFEASWEALNIAGLVSSAMPENLTAQHLLVELSRCAQAGDRAVDLFRAKRCLHKLGGNRSIEYFESLSYSARVDKAVAILRAAEQLCSGISYWSKIERLLENKQFVLDLEAALVDCKVSIRE